MKRSDFHYDLPAHLIAQYPLTERSDSRLLCLEAGRGGLTDKRFLDLADLLRADDLLVLNDTRVIPARLYGNKETGGRIEVLVERILPGRRILAQLKASKSPRPDSRLRLEGDVQAVVIERQADLYVLQFEDDRNPVEILEAAGHVPLPPYIKRPDQPIDQDRYQTIYARKPGAVAAPTAGLHFDQTMMSALSDRGIEMVYVTLHVGLGTFQPMRVEQVQDHVMHSETVEVSDETCKAINQARDEGRRVIAIGTTSVRALETAAHHGDLEPYAGETRLFIYPGYQFRVVDALITNFHLPESTLLMLVCAFGGKENVMNAYQHAIKAQYRFYSYGDAMFIYHES